MDNYVTRLKEAQASFKDSVATIDDLTPLYHDFLNRKTTRFNRLWRLSIRPFLKKYFIKRMAKGDFDRHLFSKAIFNNLYGIRQKKDDAVHFGWNEKSDFYKDCASHQYIRRELEHMSIEEIMLLSYELAKTFKRRGVK